MDFVNDSVRKYLSDGGGTVDGWTIVDCAQSTTTTTTTTQTVVAGRGVVATKDYGEGDVIFVDVPLIVSPRVIVAAVDRARPLCPVCYASATTAVTECPGGCRLPVCGRRCSKNPGHIDECQYMQRLCPKTVGQWSVAVYNAIAAIRGVRVMKDDRYKCFLNILQKKSTNKPMFEIEELKKCIDTKLEVFDEQIMTATCKIMDANCFETITNRHNNSISLKGLYPVSAFMNHCCVPNTMHNFNEKLQMIVKASLPICKGQEITTSYTNSVWPTSLRQNHLLTSKQFVCTCKRCCDPEEFGTELAAINCIIKNCDGRIFPVNPLNMMSIWQCKVCTKLVTNSEVTSIYKNVESLMSSINVFCPKSFDAILEKCNIHRDSPSVIDLKLKIIWRTKNHSLNLERLLYKEKLCVEMLNLVQKLGLGQCRLLGLLSLELWKVIEEKMDRFRWDIKTLSIFKEEIKKLKNRSSSILDANTSIYRQ